jgi:hypothetical protein
MTGVKFLRGPDFPTFRGPKLYAAARFRTKMNLDSGVRRNDANNSPGNVILNDGVKDLLSSEVIEHRVLGG